MANNPPNRKLNEYLYWFVLKCPSVKRTRDGVDELVSKQGIHFKDRDIRKGMLTTLLSEIRKFFIVPNGECRFVRVASEQVSGKIQELENEYCGMASLPQYFVIPKNVRDWSVVDLVYYYLRCSFAHGDFSYKKNRWVLKAEKKGKIRAQAFLSSETLDRLIALMNCTRDDLRAMRSKNISALSF